MGALPFSGIRIHELSQTLTGRLAGQLFADQGATVLIQRAALALDVAGRYLDRGKQALYPGELHNHTEADIIIVDGNTVVDRDSHQIILRVTAALPDDMIYGDLPADCPEGLLSALVGFFTNMAMLGPSLGRPVIFTPLALCSIYAGVLGATAAAASLVDRTRTGLGRDITISRLAAGLSAIGALSVEQTGLPSNIDAPMRPAVPEGVSLDEFKTWLSEAAQSAERQLWLEHRLLPFGAYRCADGRFLSLLWGANRRGMHQLMTHLNLWPDLRAAGVVDVDPYDPRNLHFRGRNLAEGTTLSFPLRHTVANLLEERMLEKKAQDWVDELCPLGIPAMSVNSLEEWLSDMEAKCAGLVVQLPGGQEAQLGRAAWMNLDDPYPSLQPCARLATVPSDTPVFAKSLPTGLKSGPAVSEGRPLAGFRMLDLTNVIAGPACARLLAELGVEVIRVEPARPNHASFVVVWQSETSIGKRSIIVDGEQAEGRKILHDLARSADWVLANKSDAQCTRLGFGWDQLAGLSSKLIGVQLTAHHGPDGPSARHDFCGYDPLGQAATGIMVRYGPDGCPTLHGLASCVDYLCGYLGAWAAICALHVREVRRDGGSVLWAQSSLMAAAGLAQCSLQHANLPSGAVGPFATGISSGARIYKCDDGWLYAHADHDISASLTPLSRSAGLAWCKTNAILATPVHTCSELATLRSAEPTRTISFERRESNGWCTASFAPTWFVFDGEIARCPGAARRIGADAECVLNDIGYSREEQERLAAHAVVWPAEWQREVAAEEHALS
jgi:crotonobetainyl-CoA:carnitine CoA-transferase CaiB-like acyl-CoA transferase